MRELQRLSCGGRLGGRVPNIRTHWCRRKRTETVVDSVRSGIESTITGQHEAKTELGAASRVTCSEENSVAAGFPPYARWTCVHSSLLTLYGPEHLAHGQTVRIL